MMTLKRLSIAAVLGLAACVSVLPEPTAPNALYRIGPLEPTYELSGSVVIREPDAPKFLGGGAMASIDETGALRLLRGVEWADSASRLMQLAMLDSLIATTDGAALAPPARLRDGLELDWRISELALHGREARCQLELSLFSTRPLSLIEQTQVRTTSIAAGSDPVSRAQAMSDAAEACVDAAAAFVARQSGAGAEGGTMDKSSGR
ncbi:MAG: hypothetical protein AAFS03_01020 [Pseudomonadota bacterium]